MCCSAAVGREPAALSRNESTKLSAVIEDIYQRSNQEDVCRAARSLTLNAAVTRDGPPEVG